MENPIPVTCIYNAETDVADILLQSFWHFLEIHLEEPERLAAG